MSFSLLSLCERRAGEARDPPRTHHAERGVRSARVRAMDEPRLTAPDPVIEAFKKDIDRTLLRENLKLTVEERLRNLMRLQRFAEVMREAGKRAFHGRS
jgi:hypothetical protein